MVFFKQEKELLSLSVLNGILDAQDADIIVADKDCGLLLMNAPAMSRLTKDEPLKSCKNAYAGLFHELCDYCPNGDMPEPGRPLDCTIQDSQGAHYLARYRTVELAKGETAAVIILRNIDEERTTIDKLYSLAYIDQLTGIANRRKLQEDFIAISGNAEAAGSDAMGALAIFDLDYFKNVNDTFGHGAGDCMLKLLADSIESADAFRGRLYRLGGDEFVLLFPKSPDEFDTLEDCRLHFDEVLKGVLRSYTLPDCGASCTVSVGVAYFPWHAKTYSELLHKADVALYQAKERGRNRICHFEEKNSIV